MKHIVLYIIIFSAYCELSCQSYDVGFGYARSFSFISSDFRTLNGSESCCEGFNSGNSSASSFKLFGAVRLEKNFGLALSLGISEEEMFFEQYKNEVFSLNNAPIEGTFLNELIINNKSYDVGLYANIHIDRLIYSAGLDLCLPFTNSFKQEERIVSPKDRGVFTDTGTRVRNKHSGKVADFSEFIPRAVLGVAYNFPLNKSKRLNFIPQLKLYYDLTEQVANTSIKSLSIAPSISFSYTFGDFATDTVSESKQSFSTNTSCIVSVFETSQGYENYDFEIKTFKSIITNRFFDTLLVNLIDINKDTIFTSNIDTLVFDFIFRNKANSGLFKLLFTDSKMRSREYNISNDRCFIPVHDLTSLTQDGKDLFYKVIHVNKKQQTQSISEEVRLKYYSFEQNEINEIYPLSSTNSLNSLINQIKNDANIVEISILSTDSFLPDQVKQIFKGNIPHLLKNVKYTGDINNFDKYGLDFGESWMIIKRIEKK